MKQQLIKSLLSVAGAAAGAALAGAAVSETIFEVRDYEFRSPKVRSPFSAVVLSDLHLSVFGKDNCRLVRAVRDAGPDVILLCGDFFDVHSDGSKDNGALVTRTLRALTEIAPVFFAPGNHDLRYRARTGRDCLAAAAEAGCAVLDGTWVRREIRGCPVRIGGVYDHAAFEEDFVPEIWDGGETHRFLRGFSDPQELTLLLMHRPNTLIWIDPSRWDWQIDAVFSGHAHGGLWRLPVVGGVFAPEQGFFPAYDKGEYELGNTRLFMNSGLEGFYFMPRLFNRPEIMRVSFLS